jgi:hypothetical protein
LVKFVRIPLSHIETKILTLNVSLAGGTIGEMALPNYALDYRILQCEEQHNRVDHLNFSGPFSLLVATILSVSATEQCHASVTTRSGVRWSAGAADRCRCRKML